jgi:hypothetical protein
MNRKEVTVAALGVVIGFLVGFTILNVRNIELKHQLVQADQQNIEMQKQLDANHGQQTGDPFLFGSPALGIPPLAVPKQKMQPPPPPPEPVVETDPRRQVRTI